MSTSEEDAVALRGALWDAANAFNDLRKARHEHGQQEYGEFTFLGNDVIRMMLEELADVCNYAEYMAAKLLLLQKMLEEDPRLLQHQEDGQIKIGVQSFLGTKDGWKK